MYNGKLKAITLPGLKSTSSINPSWRSLLQLSNAELEEILRPWIAQCKTILCNDEGILPTLSGLSGLPVEELAASPFGLRACLLGISKGVAALHEEIRSSSPWHPSLCAPPEVAEEADKYYDGRTWWENGKVVSSKYTGFMQDAPLLLYNPSLDSKWTPHEMLHRSLGFFYKKNLAKWEMYIGARLNESLPVSHWYGMDTILRSAPEAKLNPSVTDAGIAWITRDQDYIASQLAEMIPKFKLGLDYFAAELSLLYGLIESRKLDTRKCGNVNSPNELSFLDPESDALTYTVGHWNRLNSPHIMNLIQLILEENQDYFSDLTSYYNHVEHTANTLLFEDITIEPNVVLTKRNARTLWEVSLRVACSLDSDVESSKNVGHSKKFMDLLKTISSRVKKGMAGDQIDWKEDHLSLVTFLVEVNKNRDGTSKSKKRPKARSSTIVNEDTLSGYLQAPVEESSSIASVLNPGIISFYESQNQVADLRLQNLDVPGISKCQIKLLSHGLKTVAPITKRWLNTVFSTALNASKHKSKESKQTEYWSKIRKLETSMWVELCSKDMLMQRRPLIERMYHVLEKISGKLKMSSKSRVNLEELESDLPNDELLVLLKQNFVRPFDFALDLLHIERVVYESNKIDSTSSSYLYMSSTDIPPNISKGSVAFNPSFSVHKFNKHATIFHANAEVPSSKELNDLLKLINEDTDESPSHHCLVGNSQMTPRIVPIPDIVAQLWKWAQSSNINTLQAIPVDSFLRKAEEIAQNQIEQRVAEGGDQSNSESESESVNEDIEDTKSDVKLWLTGLIESGALVWCDK